MNVQPYDAGIKFYSDPDYFCVMKEQESIVEQINRLAQEDPVIEVVWLYGSRAKGTANESSDYDLAVAFTRPGEADRGADVSYPCDELAYQWSKKTDAKISIVDINHAPAALAYFSSSTSPSASTKAKMRFLL